MEEDPNCALYVVAGEGRDGEVELAVDEVLVQALRSAYPERAAAVTEQKVSVERSA